MKTKIYHLRFVTGQKNLVPVYQIEKGTHETNGGASIVELFDDSGKLRSTGYSFCSKADNFNRKLGRKIATERAMYLATQNLSETDRVRKNNNKAKAHIIKHAPELA